MSGATSSTTSFVKRALDFRFTLGNDPKNGQPQVFTGTGSNQMTVSGLRARADLTLQQTPAMFQLQARIYGLPQSVMNDMSTMGRRQGANNFNRVDVYAGDETYGMGLVFTGDIRDAWGNYTGAPQVSFDITASTGGVDSMTPISPTSYKGGVDVATILATIASQMTPPRTFENNGVSIILQNPYHSGNLMQQIRDICDTAGIMFCDDRGTLAIWLPGGSRHGAIPLITPDTGLVGYPTYTNKGIDVVSVFNPSIKYGARVQVKSSVKGADGTFYVGEIVHNLEAQTPGGSWFTAARLTDPIIYGERTPLQQGSGS